MVRANTARQKKATTDDEVLVFMGNRAKSVAQPKTFHLCPLGCQFYSEKRLKSFDILEFSIDVPGQGRRLTKQRCTGAVVRCQREEKNLYRVWLHFLDLPKTSREHIRCVSKNGKYLCDYCENF